MTAPAAAPARNGPAKWLFETAQFLWPWLEKRTPQEKQALVDSLTANEAAIDALDFTKDAEAALDEARRQADSEAERRRGTDQKAATYLPLVAALIPLVLTLVGALWEKKAGGAPIWLNMLLLGLAVAYSAAAGLWAFKVLQVAASHEPGLLDLEKAWGAPHPGQTLARRLLLHTRRNREGINSKVSCIKMAHVFLVRAFLTFSLLLLVNIVWYFASPAIQRWWLSPTPMVTTPKQTIAAVAEIDGLASELRTEAAWTVLDKDCRRRTAGRVTLQISPDPATPITKIPTVLWPTTSDVGAVKNIRLMCGHTTVGLVRVWSIPTRLAKLTRAPRMPDLLAGASTYAIAALKRYWPPSDPKVDPAKRPTMLLQQAVVRRDYTGRPVVLAITAVGPDVLTLP